MPLEERDIGRPDPADPILGPLSDEIDDPVLEVRKRFALVEQVEQHQRREEKEDLSFADRDQWSVDARESRKGEQTNEGLVYSKPTLTLNLLNPALQVAIQDARVSKLGVHVSSRSAKPSNTTYYLQGLVEKIQRDSGAQAIRMAAYDRMLKGGRGVYRLALEYEEEDPNLDLAAFDQVIRLKPLKDQSTWYCDPSAEELDKADADWMLHTFKLPVHERMRRWPNVPLAGGDSGAVFEDLNNNDDWYAQDETGKDRQVRIAYYSFKVRRQTTILFHRDFPQPFYEDDAPPELLELAKQKDGGVLRRIAEKVTLRLRVTDGHKVLEESEYPGMFHPYVPVLGQMSYLDGRERYRGIVSFVKDPCQGMNVMFSAAVQALSQPISLLMGDEQADELQEVLEESWVKPRVVIPYTPQIVEGTLVPPPSPISMLPSIEHLILLMQHTRDIISHLTGTPEYTTNANAVRDRSAKSADIQDEQGSRVYSTHLDQFAAISMMYEGKALVDLIPKVYDRPGRMIWVRGSSDGKEAPIILKQPFYRDHKGFPHPVPHEACGGTGFLIDPLTGAQTVDPACDGTGVAPREGAPEVFQDSQVEYIDFAEGRYAIDVSVGRQEDSRKRERVTGMTTMAGAAPDFTPYFIDQFFREMGMPEIADRIQAKLPQTQDEPGPISPVAKQMLAERDAQIQQASEALQQARQLIETQQVISQGKIAQIQAKGEVDIQRDLVKSRADVQKEQGKALADMTAEERKAELTRLLAEQENEFKLLIERMKLDSAERIALVQSADKQREQMIDAELKGEQIAAGERASARSDASRERVGERQAQSSERKTAIDNETRRQASDASTEQRREAAALTNKAKKGEDS